MPARPMSVTSRHFSATPGWVKGADRNADLGCIILPKPLTGNGGAKPFEFRYAAVSDAGLRQAALNISGYPGDKDGRTQWFHSRAAKLVKPSVVVYDIDTAGGQSGSAVWQNVNGIKTAVAIHTNGSPLGNSATRITPAVKALLDHWRSKGL